MDVLRVRYAKKRSMYSIMAMTIATTSAGRKNQMCILAIDPGATGTGWALLSTAGARLCDYGTLYGKGLTWEARAAEILYEYKRILSRSYIGQVYVESPVFMRGYGGYTTASTGDLVKLAMLCGAIYFTTIPLHGTTLVPPSQWKGQLPKSVSHRRIRGVLEQLNPYEVVGKISTHALDAIGIGLWALGKL